MRLLPVDITPHTKNPDAYFLDEEIEVEFKHNFTPTRSAVEKAVKYASRQATRMVLHILSDVSRIDLVEGVKPRFFFYQRMDYTWIVWQEEVFGFSRIEIFAGMLERKIK